MITCPVCKANNDQYSTKCNNCGSFLQNRVPNLDLFSTIWEVIENPVKAFNLIVLAEHKNYTIFLYTLTGINIVFIELWLFKLGNKFDNILALILFALFTGVLLGIALCTIVSFFHCILVKIFGGKSSFRISLGIIGYSLTPIVISLILILPIKVLTFGMYLFTSNPNPLSIKPISYIILSGLDILLLIWSFILPIIGTRLSAQISLWKSTFIIAILYTFILETLFISGKYCLFLIK